MTADKSPVAIGSHPCNRSPGSTTPPRRSSCPARRLTGTALDCDNTQPRNRTGGRASVVARLGALRERENARIASVRQDLPVVAVRRVERILHAQELNGLHQRNQDAVPQDD